MSSYSDRLKDPRWQRRRLEILQRSDFSCECCCAEDKTLHVHHKLYRKGAMPWEYEDHELQSLCEDCHAEEHKVRERLNESIAKLGISDLEGLLGYADGLIARAAVFGDQPRDDLRVWPLISFEHALGFGRCLVGKMNSAQTYELIAMQPIGDLEVYCLEVDGLPSQFAALCLADTKRSE